MKMNKQQKKGYITIQNKQQQYVLQDFFLHVAIM